MRELTDIEPKYIAYFLLSLVILGVVVYVAMWWVFETGLRADLNHDVVRSRVPPASSLPPQPRLQTDPEQDNRAEIERESRVLKEYGWVDPAGQFARVPVERAMELLLERGVK